MMITMQEKYKIQWAQEADAQELGLLHSNAWKVAYKDIIPKEVLDGITIESRITHFLNAIRGKTEETAVIKVDNKVLGFVTLGSCRDEDLENEYGEIWGIYVAEDNWNEGLGSILINWSIQELKERGFSASCLWVLKDNHIARRFYEKHGFRTDGKMKQLSFGDRIYEIRYIKDL